ncbi:hypothetical protein V5738_02045 [Salinisphaera sp. SPP-AMP-43]|uniref:hypothetical protein n=1 Tax=Salinisphaera sp. SPP-AMP-43 TaxID=3121288 RepID=UPI003C6DF6CC
MKRLLDRTIRLGLRPPGMYSVALLTLGLCMASPALAGYHSKVVTVTAYTSAPSETSGDPDTGAWSNKLTSNTVAISPDLLARGLDDGTTVAVEGFDHDFEVRDKTADDLHNTIDIYMGKDTERAQQFGEKRLRIWWHTDD